MNWATTPVLATRVMNGSLTCTLWDAALFSPTDSSSCKLAVSSELQQPARSFLVLQSIALNGQLRYVRSHKGDNGMAGQANVTLMVVKG